MSELVTLTSGASMTIYGTVAGATGYLAFGVGDQYDAYRALTADQQKMALGMATRFIDRRTWLDTVNTFALRDAITAFQQACYELATIAASSPDTLTTTETGSNVRSAGAGSARVEFFAPTSVSAGTSNALPDVVQQLVGSYLASGGSVTVVGGYGQSGSDESAFEDSGEFALVRPM